MGVIKGVCLFRGIACCRAKLEGRKAFRKMHGGEIREGGLSSCLLLLLLHIFPTLTCFS